MCFKSRRRILETLKPLITSFLVFLICAFVSACDFLSPDARVLNEFKEATPFAKEIGQCVGATGNVEWRVFQPPGNKNPKLKVIEAALTKGEDRFNIQWFYNLETKISEMAYAGKPGEETNRLFMVMNIGLFCVQSIITGPKSGLKSEGDHNSSGVGASIIAPPQGIVASPPIENIKSDSRSISGAVLGEKIKNHLYGEPLAIDGGPYYFSKNHLHLSYDGRGNNFNGLEEPIANIEFACREGAFGKSKGAVAIDGISCDSDVKEVMNNRDWKKFCYLHSFDPLDKPLPLMLRRNNAYISIQFDESANPYIRAIGITLRKVVLGEIYQDCEEAEKMKIIARQKGFKSLGNMMNPNPVEGG